MTLRKEIKRSFCRVYRLESVPERETEILWTIFCGADFVTFLEPFDVFSSLFLITEAMMAIYVADKLFRSRFAGDPRTL